MTERGEHRGRVAVVTGGSGGIGGAIVKRLSSEGVFVHVLDFEPTPGRAAGSDAISFHRVDVGNEAEIDKAFDAIGKPANRIDYLVCCAAIFPMRPFLELSLDEWRRTLQINLTGSFLSCRAALRFMRPQGFARIVLFSSMLARTGAICGAHYSAAKGGVLGLARTLAVEAAQYGIRVNTVSPGITDTPGVRAHFSEADLEARKARIPLGRIGHVQDMVEACMFLLGDESSYVTGQDIRVNGGASPW
ncbi:MAG: SDR family NAD(P)-dependent oxidoreductase [Candidatus Binatia bacterium]